MAPTGWRHASAGSCTLSHDESAPHETPSSIGPFRVLHQLGAGALGPVFRAFDPDRDRLVAVKVFRLDLTPEQTDELAQGLEAMARRCEPHPAIAMPVQAGVEGACAYLVQQYVPFDTLDMHLRRGGTGSADEAVALLRQVADALGAATRAGLRHGALHPRDILVSTTGEVMVTGIGVAEALEAVGAHPPVRRPYAAPERVAGDRWDQRADVFTVAVLAFEMLTGRRPAGTGPVAAAQFELEGAPIDVARWQAALARGLAESADDRFASASDLVDALEGRAASAAAEPPAVTATAETLPPQDELTATAEPAEPEWPLVGSDAAADGESAALDVDLDRGTVSSERSLFDLIDTPPDGPSAAEPAPVQPAEPPSRPPPEDQPAVTPVSRAAPIPDAPPVVPPQRPVRHEVRGPWSDEPLPAAARTRAWRGPALGAVAGVVLGLALGYATWGRPGSVPAAQPPDPGGAPAATTPREAVTSEPQPLTPPEVVPEPVVPPASTTRGTPTAPAPRREAPPPTRATEAARGRLSVRSSPAGARVTLNGQPRGTTPLDLRNVPFGTYDVQVARPGYAPDNRRVTLSTRTPAVSLSVSLVAGGVPAASDATRPGTAGLDIVSKPPGARVLIDGALVGLTPIRLPELAEGRHTVRLELQGHRSWTTTVTLSAGQVERVTASLEEEAPR